MTCRSAQTTHDSGEELSMTETLRNLQFELADVKNSNANLEQKYDNLAQVVAGMNVTCERTAEFLAKLSNHHNSEPPAEPVPPFPPYHAHSPSHSQTYNPNYHTASSSSIQNPKVKLNSFDGSNPLDWISQAEHYFKLYQIPPDQRISLVLFYMQGTALGWYNWMCNNDEFRTWDLFVRDLLLRFGPLSYENHQALLFKLRQTSSVIEYQQRFEQIGNLVKGLSSEAFMNCFISGLKPEIQVELAIYKPQTTNQAIDLAKLVETTLAETRRFSYPRFATSQGAAILPTPTLALPAPKQ